MADGVSISRELIRGKALRLLGRREYSQSELQKKLSEKFPEEASFIEEIIEEFIASNWISDIRYTEELVREKSQYGGWGPMKIYKRLREKGIEKEMIAQCLERIFPEEKQREFAKSLAEEKWRLLYKKTAAERRAAVQRFLASRGFSFSVILNVTELLN